MYQIRDFYESLVESSDDAIISKDADGIVVGWNPAAERLFGYTAQEMIGQSIRRLLPDDRQHEEDDILARIRNGERVSQFLTQRVSKSGELLDLSITISPVRDPSGAIVGASKIARDAGRYLADQRRIRESEERFRLLADNIAQFAWMAHPDGHIFWYNQRWFDYTGTSAEEMDGWGWTKVHHPDHVDRVVEHIQKCWDSGEEWEDTFPLRATDGSYRWFLSRAQPVRNEAGEIVRWFGTNTDITEQREQQEQIRLLLLEVNHRSKNMLAIVQALARRTAPDDAGFIARFEERVRSLAVNQDILVRREWREVPVEELARKQLGFVQNAPGALEFAGPACNLTPRAAEVVGMALHELATNSLKYGALSQEGGHVLISWAIRAADGGFTISWHETGGPPVTAPSKTGFGTSLICDIPRRSLSAEVTLDYPPEGLHWTMACGPLAFVAEPETKEVNRAPE